MTEVVVSNKRLLDDLISDASQLEDEDLIALIEAVKENLKRRKLGDTILAGETLLSDVTTLDDDENHWVDFKVSVSISSENIPSDRDLQDKFARADEYIVRGAKALMFEEFLPENFPDDDSFERISDWRYGDWDNGISATGSTTLTLGYKPFEKSVIKGLGFDVESGKFFCFNKQFLHLLEYKWIEGSFPKTKQELKEQWKAYCSDQKGLGTLWKHCNFTPMQSNKIIDELVPIYAKCILKC